MNKFKNRVFGCAIVKAVNANYNADFTHQPRTLPDGTVYATDKAFKYSVRHYLKDRYSDENIFFYKRLNQDMNPLTLAETYDFVFGNNGDESKLANDDKSTVLKNLLACLDIKLFGATFAAKSRAKNVNISIHGPVQINHAMNRFATGEIYSEQIMSPFRNPGADGSDEKAMTTLGQQSKLREGHYVHHFSINPQNLSGIKKLVENASGLTDDDIAKLKEAMCSGVTYYDSASKAGTDNELLLWVQLHEDSRAVLPAFTEFINVLREDGKVCIDLGDLGSVINKISDQVEKIEVYYSPESTQVRNLPDNTEQFEITTTNTM
ncbi:MAG: type I CRISPR-associated protein Cas7 [bacterium]